jgi:hypothetical protein
MNRSATHFAVCGTLVVTAPKKQSMYYALRAFKFVKKKASSYGAFVVDEAVQVEMHEVHLMFIQGTWGWG